MRVSLLSTLVTTLLFTGALACPTKHDGKHGGKHDAKHGGHNGGKDVGQDGGKQVLPPSWTPGPEVAGKKSLAYYGNWDIYARSFMVTDIPADKLTHLSYAFANINTTTGSIVLSDEWADLQYSYPGDDNTAPGTNVYGNIKQLYLLKKAHRNLKTILSVGGWTYRMNFGPMLASETKRRQFVASAMELVSDLGFDGLDIDYEYVDGAEQAAQMVSLLKDLRAGFHALEKKLNATSPFIISYASPAGPDKYKLLDLANMTPYVDFYSFMALDYQGGFSNYSGHQANLFTDVSNPKSTDFETNSGILHYISTGAPANKILLQSPLYGRSFNLTAGPGTKFADVGTLGSFGTAGVWDYKALPVPGFNASVVELPAIGASYSYDAARKYMISYDTPAIAAVKAEYVKSLGLGGAAWWEVSMDRNDTKSLISTTVNAFGGAHGLEKRKNNLNYPTSKYANLRAGMPGL
ncbi:endochitinase B1 [Aspergillus lentulus]|uniref:chitinase n=1 Tax=Aspergillus lentulus TaxID=293939 RepID=A0AAN4PAT5_ASPLE|nr:endochitinase B1 [Aspergillus lentulus]